MIDRNKQAMKEFDGIAPNDSEAYARYFAKWWLRPVAIESL